jgi:ligand-binding sensor domain-containing protein
VAEAIEHPRVAIPSRARVVARATWKTEDVIATDLGLFALAPGSASFRAIELGDTLPCGDRISALVVHRGALYVGSFDRGLCRFDGKTFVHVAGASELPSPMVNDLASDGERLFIATARGLSIMQADGRFVQYVHGDCVDDLRAACPWYPSVNGVAVEAGSPRVWISDLGSVHGITHAGTGSGASFAHVDGTRVGSRSLTRMAMHAGRLAVGSSDGGVLLAQLDASDKPRFRRIDHQRGLADDWVVDLTFDANGALWIATCTRGVSVLDAHGVLRTLTVDDGLADDYALSVNAIDGQLFVGTLRGLSIVTGDSVQTLRDGLSGEEVHDAVQFQGEVWLATDGGLSVLARDDHGDRGDHGDHGDVPGPSRYAR